MTTPIDVDQGEIVPAYAQNGREEDGNIFDVTVRRSYGDGRKAKSTDYIGFLLLVRLNKIPDGRVHIGERSSPAEISAEFPGVSKRDFKKVRAGESEQQQQQQQTGSSLSLDPSLQNTFCVVWYRVSCDLIAASFFFFFVLMCVFP